LGKVSILKDDGVLVIRTRKQRDLAPRFEQLIKYRISNYGESTLHYYRCMEEGQE